MKQDIRLFIANQEVDFTSDLNISYTYQLEDLTDPTAVKNSFSKTLTIPASEKNNKIFGEIYNLDRYQLSNADYVAGVYFNPSQRTPFQLFRNADLIESGYIQLNNISIKNKQITYQITLYGGLGDFLYNLMYNDETGDKLTLADLRYFVEDADGTVLPSENEFDFSISKEVVYDCMFNLNATGSQLYNYLAFVPSYNGLYDEFSNDTVLINTYNSQIFTTTAATEDGKTYTTYNGYALGKLNKEYTEFEIRDLRSYMQRPAIKLSKVIEAICNPENNGGYQVNLSNSFFSEKNPYYNKAYIALPLLNTSNSNSFTQQENATLTFNENIMWVGKKTTEIIPTSNVYLNVSGNTVITSKDGIIDLTNIPISSVFNLSIDFQIFFNSITETDFNDLYISYVRNGKDGLTNYTNYPYFTSLAAQVLIYDADDPNVNKSPIGYSDLYNFTTEVNSYNGKQSGPSEWFQYTAPSPAAVIDVFGHFKKNNNNQFYFEDENGNNTFVLSAKNIQRYKHINIVFAIGRYVQGTTNQEKLWGFDNMAPSDVTKYSVSGWFEFLTTESNLFTADYDFEEISSFVKINKQKLLKTENSPGDYLLDYCKLFGLYLEKDRYSKTINILTRNEYFENVVNDFQNRIDYNKDFQIYPIIFDKKFYRLAADTPDTYYSKKYNTQYNIDYGQKRINTNYNFNSDTSDIYSDNVYQNVISISDQSVYYRNFFNNDNLNVPAFLSDNMNYVLYSGVGTDDESEYETELYGKDYINLSKTTDWNILTGYDLFPKLCAFDISNNQKNLSDFSSTLLFFNGYENLTDIRNNPITYWLTDDLPEMTVLNEEMCYLYTESETDKNGNNIAKKLTQLPNFNRYEIDSSNVISSMDFGKPLEIYINNINYEDAATVYDKFWKNFYTDQFNINTKKVICYVNLNGLNVNSDMLKQFYYFNNSIWILNKISDYNVNSYDTVKCEFIKVQNIANYIDGQFSY